ncbi:ACT domain-containing protein [Dermatophilaceae bacterium Soc4.6]
MLTVIGDDRPGLVRAVSAPVESHGGSWHRSQLARLAGKFAGIVQVSVPDDRVADLERDLTALAAEGLQVTVARTDEETRAQRVWLLHLIGSDRPGIVAEVSGALARAGVSIDELETQVRDAPMAGGVLFEARARLSVSLDVDVEQVRSELERLADELLVDLDLESAAAG